MREVTVFELLQKLLTPAICEPCSSDSFACARTYQQLLAWATEIKVRAERRAGEMLAQMPKATGTRGQLAGGTSRVPPENAPTLAAMDISKNESSRWQKLAAIPEAEFDAAVVQAKAAAGGQSGPGRLKTGRQSCRAWLVLR